MIKMLLILSSIPELAVPGCILGKTLYAIFNYAYSYWIKESTRCGSPILTNDLQAEPPKRVLYVGVVR